MPAPPRLALAAHAILVACPAIAAQAYLDDRSTPETVSASFYDAISKQEYSRAWSYYADGQGVPKFDDFVKGYSNTASVKVAFGPDNGEGAAGSTFWTLPVSLD